MNILGINAYHADSSACLVRGGVLVAAAEEERFRRVKHWAGFPTEAVRYCLESQGLFASDIDHVAVNRDPSANRLNKALFVLKNHPDLSAIRDRLRNAAKVGDVRAPLAAALGVPVNKLKAKFHSIEHHRAHLASAFYVSGFDEAAAVSVDGFGDFVSTQWGIGRKNRISVKDEVRFPHSLGLYYLAMTQYLGFPNYGDEYKVMGLSAYGKPELTDLVGRLVKLKPDGRFELDLRYFSHHSEGVSMVWESGSPVIGRVFTDELVRLLGPARAPDEAIDERHKALAASMQAVYERAFFHLLRHVHRKTRQTALCLAGGCAQNSVANGKLFSETGFKRFYGQAAAGDAGGAIGAAFELWHGKFRKKRDFKMEHAYWGPSFTEADITAVLRAREADLKRAGAHSAVINDDSLLCERAAAAVAAGRVVGWFQGRMEWGPRALGNRSIIGDPRRADMKDILNKKIKRRESFRPFAPSVLREKTGEWFETDADVPFMMQVFQIRPEKRDAVPAVTHVNGSGRLQTVAREENQLYHRLIRAFDKQTGVPMVLNTSFNENEPIVCRPEEALDCFLRTNMDVLVLGRTFIERNA